ncbi:hypothetical protein MP228_003291 [Amoeboaphelidium protococcarum]|nr:hypothetical protein MP228_003291 [Amoeboaphelidium protococcarum]
MHASNIDLTMRWWKLCYLLISYAATSVASQNSTTLPLNATASALVNVTSSTLSNQASSTTLLNFTMSSSPVSQSSPSSVIGLTSSTTVESQSSTYTSSTTMVSSSTSMQPTQQSSSAPSVTTVSTTASSHVLFGLQSTVTHTSATTTNRNGLIGEQGVATAQQNVPLDVNMQNAINTGRFFLTNFGNLSNSIPVTIVSTCLGFIFIYAVMQWRNRAQIQKEVNKYKNQMKSKQQQQQPTTTTGGPSDQQQIVMQSATMPMSAYSNAGGNTQPLNNFGQSQTSATLPLNGNTAGGFQSQPVTQVGNYGTMGGNNGLFNGQQQQQQQQQQFGFNSASMPIGSRPISVMQGSAVNPLAQQMNGSNMNTQTGFAFNVNFNGAGVGYQMDPNAPYMFAEGQNHTQQHGIFGDEAEDERTDIGPQQLQNPADPSSYVSAEATAFALPGFLQLNFSDDLRLKGKFSEGGGGVIYKAQLLNQDFCQKFGVEAVVVKVLKPLPHMAFSELKTLVYQEIAIMQSLSHHPNIITLIGFTDEPLSIVMKQYDRNLFSLVMSLPEYAANASEFEALKSFVKTDSKLKKGLIVKGFEMLPEIALHISWGIAAGMNEMHHVGILHRDLKSANVLLEFKASALTGEKPVWQTDPSLAAMANKISGSFGQNALAGGVGWGQDAQGRPFCPVNPVVCDFGLAKVIKKSPNESAAVKGMKETSAVGISYRYAAPEAFNRMYHKTGGVNDEGKPVDVYAFAVMVWELLERKVPFHKLSNKEVEAKVRGGERPAISPQYKVDGKPYEGNRHYTLITKLIDICWRQDPRERPSFYEIKQKLKPFWLGFKDPKDFGNPVTQTMTAVSGTVPLQRTTSMMQAPNSQKMGKTQTSFM